MKDWWGSLQYRDRMLLLATTALVLAAVFYLFAYEPIIKKHNTLTQRIDTQRQLAAWMQDTSVKIKQLQGASEAAPVVSSNTSMLSIIESSSRQANLRSPIQRMEPEGTNGVKLWIEKAPFDSVIQWLGELNRQHQIEVSRASINKSDDPGLVTLQLSLIR